jgi:hypothetical protein
LNQDVTGRVEIFLALFFRLDRTMAIVDDYAGIAAELRRIRAGNSPPETPTVAPREPASQHRMRTTIIGDLIYRGLVANSRRAARRPATDGLSAELGD